MINFAEIKTKMAESRSFLIVFTHYLGNVAFIIFKAVI